MMVGTPIKTITVGLLWHSISSDNLGVGALTESQIAICEAAAKQVNCNVKYVVFGTAGGRDYMPKNLPITLGGRVSIKQMLLGRSQFLKGIEHCDVVLDIGEGDSFADIYGIKRYLFLITSKLGVLLKGKPLILSPQTIGPFEHWWTRKLSSAVMKRSARVYARDGLSYQYLQACGVTNNIDEVIDVAFKLPFDAVKHQNNKVNIGVNVSGLLFSGGYTKNNQFGLSLDYSSLIHALLDEWTQNPDYQVWLIPHVIPDDLPVEDDRSAIALLKQAYPQVAVAPEFESPSDAKSLIAGMDFMTGARMHACIAAFSAGVPVVPLAYSRKFNGLFNSLDYRWLADGKAMTTEDALTTIKEGFEARDQLAKEVNHGVQLANKRLAKYQSFLSNFFESLMHDKD